MARIVINNNDLGLTVRNALNAMTLELYGSTVPPVKLLDQTGSFTQAVTADTWIDKIIVTPVSGTPDIKIGTSLGGSEIMDTTQIGNYVIVLAQQYFTNVGTLYFVASGGNVNIRIDQVLNFTL
jgi:hypothetical protein